MMYFVFEANIKLLFFVNYRRLNAENIKTQLQYQ